MSYYICIQYIYDTVLEISRRQLFKNLHIVRVGLKHLATMYCVRVPGNPVPLYAHTRYCVVLYREPRTSWP